MGGILLSYMTDERDYIVDWTDDNFGIRFLGSEPKVPKVTTLWTDDNFGIRLLGYLNYLVGDSDCFDWVADPRICSRAKIIIPGLLKKCFTHINKTITFGRSGTIVDSGTVITRLPPTAYTALRDSFKQQMSKYPLAPGLSILDTCYDFSNYTSVTIPKIAFIFAGNANVVLGANGILVAASQSQICLAFAPNSDDTDTGIYGNVQQQTFEVAYDVAGGRLGFGPNGCS